MSPNKIYSVPAYARKIPADRVRLNEPSETDIYYKAENGDIWVVGSLAYNELSASDVIDSEQELFGRKRYYSDMFRVISDTGIAIGLMGNDKGNSKGKKLTILILSILVDTFISKISLTMQPGPKIDSISGA